MTRRFTEATIAEILTSHESHAQVARRYGVTKQAISLIRLGRSYGHVAPHLPRRSAASCLQCQHWEGHCSWGFPDPDEEGPGFAAECEQFQTRS